MVSDDDPKERWEKQAKVRDDQAGVREDQAEVREDQSEVREDQSGIREDSADVRERQAEEREVQAHDREVQADVRTAIFDEQYRRLENLLKVITFIVVLLFVGTIIAFFRQSTVTSAVNSLEAKTTQLESQTDVARDAAVNARDILQEALNEAEARRTEAGEGSSPTAIRDALQSIGRIERHLCGGPCNDISEP